MNSAYILIISYDSLLCLQVELKLQVIVLTFLNKFSSRALTPHLPIQIEILQLKVSADNSGPFFQSENV